MKQLPLPTHLIVDLPPGTVAKAVTQEGGKRLVYFEATRDGVVDREGEMVAAEALWKSRDLMLSQGDLDISHWAHLANPQTGRPDPEYRIGHPTQVTRSGKSIWVAGEIYRPGTALNPPAKQGDPWWPDYFWHSVAKQDPPARWFPSVYGKIVPGGIEVVQVKGRPVRRITNVQWYSVGFALRAQHPDLGPVSLSPVGNLQAPALMAKADEGGMRARAEQGGTLHLPWASFAKSVAEVGMPITDHAALTGVQALTRTSLEGQPKQASAPGRDKLRLKVLRAVHAELIPGTVAGMTRYLRQQGLSAGEAEQMAQEIDAQIQERTR